MDSENEIKFDLVLSPKQSFGVFSAIAIKSLNKGFFWALAAGFFVLSYFFLTVENVQAQESLLLGNCFADPATVSVGQTVAWHANISGGRGLHSYIHQWSGSDSLVGQSGSLVKTYNTPGVKTATVKVKSGDQQIFRNCSVTVTAAEPVFAADPSGVVLGDHIQGQMAGDFFAACTADPSMAKIGEEVVWTVLAIGGPGLYEYLWFGTDGLIGTSQTVKKTYTSVGEKLASVMVISDGQNSQVACAMEVVEEGMVAGAITERLEGYSAKSFRLFLIVLLFLLGVTLIILFFAMRRKVIREEEQYSLAYEPARAEEKDKNGNGKDISIILQEEARKSDILMSVDALKILIEKSDNNIEKALENLGGILEFKKGLPCPVIEGEERCDVLTKGEVGKYFIKQGVDSVTSYP